MLFFVAQHGAFAHVLSHLGDAAAGWPQLAGQRLASGDAGAGHVVACEKCLEYAGLGSALPVSVAVPAVSTPPAEWAIRLPEGVPAVFLAVYRSRAPPSSSGVGE